MLFSTSLTLGPNKLPIQLQVSLGPSPAQGGAPGAPANTPRPGSSLLMDALRPAGLGFMHVGAPRGVGRTRTQVHTPGNDGACYRICPCGILSQFLQEELFSLAMLMAKILKHFS